jgi:hypothetical protein
MAGLRRPGVVLIIAIVLWFPSARRLLAGDVTLDAAATRLLLAIALAWAAVGVLLRVTAAYRGVGTAEVVEVPRRRHDDPDELVGS